MALTVCEDCGHVVSDLAFACPNCARPVSPAGGPRVPTVQPTVVAAQPTAIPHGEPGPPSPPPHAGAPAHSIVHEGWLKDLRQHLDLPARSKVCKRCDGDVTLDMFREKVDDGYVCGECIVEAEERRYSRRYAVIKAVAAAGLIAMVAALVVGTLYVAPVLLKPHSTGAR